MTGAHHIRCVIRRAYESRLSARLLLLTVVLATMLLADVALPLRAEAVIHPASVLDGPANNIIDVDGSSMAPDGSGGIVYRKELEGVVHVFTVQFQNGRWSAPIEVDGEDLYGASQPAIAAGEGGRLLVVWVQPRNVSPQNVTEYELMSASLQPGAGAFGQAIAVDPNVGEPRIGDASAVDPRLAMAPDGTAYVVYRVAADDCGLGDEGNPEEAKCRPGTADKVIYIRVARFNYLTWSSLGVINRSPQLAMRNPTPENAPAIGIALNGNGVVAWQEPDAGGIARIWVRRLFGMVQGNVLQASPSTLEGRPVTSDADAPTVAVGPYGEARIAFRILGGPSSAVQGTQLFLNSILSEIAPHGAQLLGATPVAGAAQGTLGSPSEAIDPKGNFRMSWTGAGAVRELEGNTRTVDPPLAIGSATGQAPTTINPAGGGTTAWVGSPGEPTVVQVREDYAQDAFQTALLAGNVPGPVEGLSLAGDGQGDALLGFTQGPPGRSEVLGSFVQAPPAPFVVSPPNGWVRARDADITWESAFDAVQGVTYTVYVDGKAQLKGLTGLHARLGSNGLGDGVHRVQVLASDASAQQTMSPETILKVDVNPPIVKIKLIDGRSGVRITAVDRASGVDAHATNISFGDGHSLKGHAKASHIYRQAGTYWITTQARDKVGNRSTVHIRVRVQ